jgi:hypothetical protein
MARSPIALVGLRTQICHSAKSGAMNSKSFVWAINFWWGRGIGIGIGNLTNTVRARGRA